MPAENRPTTNTLTIGCMLVMLFGAILYGGALEVSMVGVLCAILNMAIAVTDRLIQRRLLTEQCKSLPSTVCAILNNGLALIPTMLLAGFSHELEHATSAKMAQHWTNPVVLIFLIASGFIGMCVGYFGTECQRELTATSFFVMGNATKCGVVLLVKLRKLCVVLRENTKLGIKIVTELRKLDLAFRELLDSGIDFFMELRDFCLAARSFCEGVVMNCTELQKL